MKLADAVAALWKEVDSPYGSVDQKAKIKTVLLELQSGQEVARICADANKNMQDAVRRLTTELQAANTQVRELQDLLWEIGNGDVSKPLSREQSMKILKLLNKTKYEYTGTRADDIPANCDCGHPRDEHSIRIYECYYKGCPCAKFVGAKTRERDSRKCYGTSGENEWMAHDEVGWKCRRCGQVIEKRDDEIKAEPRFWNCCGKPVVQGDAAHPYLCKAEARANCRHLRTTSVGRNASVCADCGVPVNV